MGAVNRRVLQQGEKIRVLIVDDSVVIRRLVRHALEQDATIEVVGTASNGSIALQRIPQLNPDAITLDIEMPEMDGLETLRRLRREYSHLRVIMFSTLTDRGADVTLQALSLGADDYVAKASNEGSLDRSLVRLREELVPKIRQFFLMPAADRVAGPKPMPAAGVNPCAAWGIQPRAGGGGRRFHWWAGRAGGDPAASSGRFSAAHSDSAAYAAAFYAAFGRAITRHLPGGGGRGAPWPDCRAGEDSHCAGRLPHDGGIERQQRANFSGPVAAAELLPSRGGRSVRLRG